jgi:molybdate transport system substrate-binding protein
MRFAFLVLLLISNRSEAAELRVLAIGATAPTLQRVIPEFERASGHRVVASFGPPGPMIEKIASGEVIDAIFISGPRYDDLVKSRAIDAGLVVARFGVGIGIPKGAAKPDVSTAEALKNTLLSAKALGGLGFDNGSVGTETLIGFHKLGIADQLVPKYRVYPNGMSVVQALVRHEIDFGFSVFADMAASKEIDYAGPYPPGIQTYVPIYATVRIGTPNEAAVKSLIELVRSKATAEFLKENWLLPASD